ncbi:hypothetical protein CHS0354_022432 [Potamilus streckersoni]|uniref:Uncharacterized protein n=1 Tax=Potamilus streckersoni TaxID=2493646 RepID=A0AAE0SY89_9BIVA|nr:hypothetical protein CHS0354_022432 [Potamilus streckersoni]
MDLWQGLRAAFGTLQIHGGAFEFGKALWKKIVYQELDSTNKLLQKVFAFPLLPADDIPRSLAELQRRVDPEALNELSFIKYVEVNWINNGT